VRFPPVQFQAFSSGVSLGVTVGAKTRGQDMDKARLAKIVVSANVEAVTIPSTARTGTDTIGTSSRRLSEHATARSCW